MTVIDKTFPLTEDLISCGLSLTEQLLRALQQESIFLTHAPLIEMLDEITSQKQPLIQELNQFSRQLAHVLETEKLPNSRSGLSEYLERAERAGFDIKQTNTDWSELIEKSEKCKLINEQNGASIDLLLRHTKQSLNILKGKPQAAQTYGPDGSPNPEPISRALFSA